MTEEQEHTGMISIRDAYIISKNCLSCRAPRSRRPPGIRLIVTGVSRDTSWQVRLFFLILVVVKSYGLGLVFFSAPPVTCKCGRPRAVIRIIGPSPSLAMDWKLKLSQLWMNLMLRYCP